MKTWTYKICFDRNSDGRQTKTPSAFSWGQDHENLSPNICSWKYEYKRFVSIGTPMAGNQRSESAFSWGQGHANMNPNTCSWKHEHKRFVSIGVPIAGNQRPEARLAEGRVMKTWTKILVHETWTSKIRFYRNCDGRQAKTRKPI